MTTHIISWGNRFLSKWQKSLRNNNFAISLTLLLIPNRHNIATNKIEIKVIPLQRVQSHDIDSTWKHKLALPHINPHHESYQKQLEIHHSNNMLLIEQGLQL